MLVLTRRNGELFVIEGDIIVTILGDARGRIKVGVDAPREVPVHREEVYKKFRTNRISSPT